MEETDSKGWPFFRIQLMGILPGTAASKRYEAKLWRTLWIPLLLGGFIGLAGLPPLKPHLQTWVAPVSILFAAGWATFTVRSFLTMLKDADELERQIHLEAIPIVLGAGIAASVVGGVAGYFYGWSINPGWFYLLEILRGVLVTMKAKKYTS